MPVTDSHALQTLDTEPVLEVEDGGNVCALEQKSSVLSEEIVWSGVGSDPADEEEMKVRA